ncbi:MAG: two-component regulator propeller domain-containing protein [Verrucomicrobiota bacterium]
MTDMILRAKSGGFGRRRRGVYSCLMAGVLGAFLSDLVETAGAASTNLPPADYSITAWSTEDGLPANSVTALLQARDGYLWVGTTHGLARFDGVRFQVFNQANCPALPSSQIMGLFEVGNDTLLISTERGGLVALQSGQFSRLTVTGKVNDHVTACLKLAADEWLLATYSGALSRWRAGKLEAIATLGNFSTVRHQDLVRDKQGRVWMLVNKSRLLALAGNEFKEVKLAGALAGSQCNSLAADQQGELWLGTSKGLARLVKDDFEPVLATGFPGDTWVSGVMGTRAGGLWIQASNWRVRYCKGSRVGPESRLTGIKTMVNILGEDRWGRIMFGGQYSEGLFLVSQDGGVAHLTRDSGLPGNIVVCYLADREGNEWLGLTDGGLVRLRPRLWQLLPGASSLSSASTESVCESHDGAVWMGTSLGGVYRFLNGAVAFYGAKDLQLTHVLSIVEDHSSNLWFGTSWDGAYQFQTNRFVQIFPPTQLPGRINVIHEDPGQVLWFGCGSGLVSFRDGQWQKYVFGDSVDNVQVKTIATDRAGRMWIGTGTDGLWCRQSNRIMPVLTNSLAKSPIWSLYVDADNTLWIGTQGGGLGRLHDGQLATFTKNDGLWDDTITHMAEDARGQLWLGSQRGAFRVAKRDLEAFAEGRIEEIPCVGYGQADGMPSADCQGGFQPAGGTMRDGRLLFPTLKGVAVVDPEAVTINPLPPPVLIEEVVVDGGESTLNSSGSTLTVPPGKGRLEIHFTALSFSDPKNVRFKCRLQGLEKNWVDVGPHRSVNYSYLRPGDYTFQVQACNNDGVWNHEGATLAVKILPHFWETRWFIVALLGSGAAAIAFTVRRIEKQKARRKLERLQHEQSVEIERARIAQDIHDDLGASLTRMTVLSELVKADKQSPEEVENHATRIGASADAAVKSLDAIVWAVNPRNDTLDSLLQYLSHFAYDFFQQTAMTCQLDLPAEVPPISLTAEVRHNLFLAVKEALNNALKHSGGTEVSLRVALRDSELEIQVADNGSGFVIPASDAGAKRNGLGNMKQRVDAIGGTLHIKSQPGRGTAVGVKLHLYAGGTSRSIRQNGRDGNRA